MPGRVVVGASILVFINGYLYGQVTGLRWDSQTPTAARMGIDSMTAYELSPTTAKVSGSVSVLRLHGDGGLEGRGIVAPFSHIPRERYFSILVIDRKNRKILHRADHCKVATQSWNYTTRARVEGSFTFEGIEWTNEASYEDAP